jgi:hypothetical protein
VPIDPGVDFAFFPSQVLSDPVGGKFPGSPFLADCAFGDGKYCGYLACGENFVRAAERSRPWRGPVARRPLAGPRCATFCARPVVRPFGCVRAFTCRRAREKREGTNPGTITHGDHSPGSLSAPPSPADLDGPARVGVLPQVPVQFGALPSGNVLPWGAQPEEIRGPHARAEGGCRSRAVSKVRRKSGILHDSGGQNRT